MFKKKKKPQVDLILELAQVQEDKTRLMNHVHDKKVRKMFECLDRKLNIIMLAVLNPKGIEKALKESEFKLKDYKLSQELNDLELFENGKL